MVVLTWYTISCGHYAAKIIFNGVFTFAFTFERFFKRPAGQNGPTGAAPRHALTIQTATAGHKKRIKEGTPQGYDSRPPRPPVSPLSSSKTKKHSDIYNTHKLITKI